MLLSFEDLGSARFTDSSFLNVSKTSMILQFAWRLLFGWEICVSGWSRAQSGSGNSSTQYLCPLAQHCAHLLMSLVPSLLTPQFSFPFTFGTSKIRPICYSVEAKRAFYNSEGRIFLRHRFYIISY